MDELFELRQKIILLEQQVKAQNLIIEDLRFRLIKKQILEVFTRVATNHKVTQP